MKKRKKWWIVALVIVVAVLGFGGYTLYQGAAQQNAVLAAESSEQETAIVERGTLRMTVDGSGSLSPDQEVPVSFASGGDVVEVLVEVGDVVEAGDVLARLDDTDAVQAVEEAKLQVRQNEISLALAELEAESGMSQANLEAAQADYERTVTTNAHTGDQLTSARITLKQAEEQLADAQQAYEDAWTTDRDWELQVDRYKNQLENERETTEDALEAAKDNLTVAQASYNLAVIGIDDTTTQDAQIQVLNAQITLDKEPIQLEQTKLTLEQSQFQLETAQRNLDDLTLVAPVDGTVTELNLEVGQLAGAGQTAVVLSDLATLVVEIGLDESDIASVSLDQEAIITLDAFDDVELRGTITAIAPTADTQSGVVLYPVTVALDPTDLPVRAGMTADVEIVTSSAANALLIPLKAVRSVGDGTFVLRELKEGETLSTPDAGQEQMTDTMQQLIAQGFTPVPVELGLVTETHAEVLSGLETGDVVSIASSAPTSDEPSGGMGFGPFGRNRP